MQTIKINIEPTPRGWEFCNGSKAVASVVNISGGFALYVANKPYGVVESFAMAVELIGDKIEALFGSLGLDVEFN